MKVSKSVLFRCEYTRGGRGVHENIFFVIMVVIAIGRAGASDAALRRSLMRCYSPDTWVWRGLFGNHAGVVTIVVIIVLVIVCCVEMVLFRIRVWCMVTNIHARFYKRSFRERRVLYTIWDHVLWKIKSDVRRNYKGSEITCGEEKGWLFAFFIYKSNEY